jgi:hypothetical protein
MNLGKLLPDLLTAVVFRTIIHHENLVPQGSRRPDYRPEAGMKVISMVIIDDKDG